MTQSFNQGSISRCKQLNNFAQPLQWSLITAFTKDWFLSCDQNPLICCLTEHHISATLLKPRICIWKLTLQVEQLLTPQFFEFFAAVLTMLWLAWRVQFDDLLRQI